MALFILDLDGTLFVHGTNDPLPGAQAFVDRIVETGGQILFTTRRNEHQLAREAIDSLNVPYLTIVFNADNPRIVVNDQGAVGHNHPTNGPWDELEISEATRS